jgi:hypothetical protein
MRSLKAGVTYFLLVFVAGWILGPIRVLWVAPRFGPLIATLLEAVVMVIVMIMAARLAIRRFGVATSLAATISMGLIAFGLLIPAEIIGVVWIRTFSLKEYLGTFFSPAGLVALSMFLLFAAMPTFVSRLGGQR